MPPHGPALLRLTPAGGDDKPLLVGSDLHISMGSAELASVESTRSGIRIALTDAGAREGNLFVYSERPLILSAASGCSAQVFPGKSSVWRIALKGRERGKLNEVRLGVR